MAIIPTPESEGADIGFAFVAGALALDLVNTEVIIRGKPYDLLATPGRLAAWWRAAQGNQPHATDPNADRVVRDDGAALAAAKRLRAALRRIFVAVADAGDGRAVAAADLAVLNGVLATGYEVVALDAGGELRSAVGSRESGPDSALLPIARSAFDLLTTKEAARLHRCGNDRCVLLFYDTTKSATRRWCSVGCMNRARSAARYKAFREGKAAGVARAGKAAGI